MIRLTGRVLLLALCSLIAPALLQAQDTSLARVHYKMARKYAASQDFNSALYFLNKAIAINPANATYYSERATVYLEMNQADSGLADFNRAIAIKPTSARLYFYRSDLYLIMQKPDEAVADICKAAELEPRNKSVLMQKAFVLAKVKRYDEAAAQYDKLMRIDPKNPGIYYNKGKLEEIQKKWNEAIALYTKAISLGDKLSYNNRAICREEIKDVEGAEKDYNMVVQLKPHDPEVYANRGRFLLEQNKLDLAKEDLKQWNSMLPDDAESWYYLARLLKKQNDPEACIYAKKAKELGAKESFEISDFCK
ncbi:MAG: tetratricopeptide repeat protein [Bacteroidetes bacterium]|nr:tetratricopeptide repeat protein [Bacteroidota bacterium]